VSKFKAVSIDAAFGLMERLVGGTTEVMANPIGTTHAVVIAREGREIQYAATSRFNHVCHGVLDRPPARATTVCG
jgi:hypothetical protein